MQLFTGIVARELGIEPASIDPDELFLSIGLDSVNCIVVLEQLEKQLHRELNPILFWDYPTINQLAGFLADDPS